MRVSVGVARVGYAESLRSRPVVLIRRASFVAGSAFGHPAFDAALKAGCRLWPGVLWLFRLL